MSESDTKPTAAECAQLLRAIAADIISGASKQLYNDAAEHLEDYAKSHTSGSVTTSIYELVQHLDNLQAEVKRLRELPYEVALTKSVRGFSEPDPLPPCPVCGSKLMANEQQYARCERLATCGFALRRDAVSELCRLVEAGRATQG